MADTTEVSLPQSDTKSLRIKIASGLNAVAMQMVTDYKNTIKQNGGLLTQSMVYAYSKGLNDAIKVILKEDSNG